MKHYRTVIWADGTTVVRFGLDEHDRVIEHWSDGYTKTHVARHDNRQQALSALNTLANHMKYVNS